MSINQLFGNVLPMVHYKHITLESGADENPLELDPHIQELDYKQSTLWLEYSVKMEDLDIDPEQIALAAMNLAVGSAPLFLHGNEDWLKQTIWCKYNS